jgi:glutamine amidotransferase
VGNLFSLKKAFEYCGVTPTLSEEAGDFETADALVLPGVGSFEAGMRGLRARGLVLGVKKFASSGKPMLGICLGAQLMLSRGLEFGEWTGLNIISGTVPPFPKITEKIPHIGWNAVTEERRRSFDAYFLHSYILKPDNPADVFGVTAYGGISFCSEMKKGRVLGVQFHPEKSGAAGLALIGEFVSFA